MYSQINFSHLRLEDTTSESFKGNLRKPGTRDPRSSYQIPAIHIAKFAQFRKAIKSCHSVLPCFGFFKLLSI